MVTLVLILLASAPPASAGTGFLSGGGTTASAFEKIASGARPAAMGDAYTAAADDAHAVDWNPAGLTGLSDIHLHFLHTQWLLEVGIESLTYAQPAGSSGGLGVSVSWLHTAGVRRTAYDPGQKTSSYGAAFSDVGEVAGSGFSFGFAYGNRLDSLIKMRPVDIAIGLGMRVVAERMDTDTNYGVGGDLGLLWLFHENLTFGFVLQHAGAGSSGFLLPITSRLGVAYQRRGLVAPKDRLILAGEAVAYIETRPQFHLGLEYRWALGRSGLVARLGYRFVQDLGFVAGLTMGGGIDLYLGGLHVVLDYAYVKYGVLGNSHRMGVTLRF